MALDRLAALNLDEVVAQEIGWIAASVIIAETLDVRRFPTKVEVCVSFERR